LSLYLTMSATKKYTLFSAANAEAGAKPVCAFFASAAGCRNGDKCKFSHTLASKNSSAPHRPSAETSSVVSSESSVSVMDDAPVAAPTPTAAPPAVVFAAPAAIKKESSGNDDNIFVKMADVKQAKASDAAEAEKKKKRRGKRSLDEDPFANPKSKVAKTEEPPKKVAPKKDPPPPVVTTVKSAIKKPKQTPTQPTATPTGSSFWAMDLPVASFSCMPSDEPETIKSETATAPTPTAAATPSNAPSAKKDDTPKRPVPKANPIGRKWLAAIQKTVKHPRYVRSYDFIRYQQQDVEVGLTASAWIEAKPYGEWCAKNPQVIAMDCEMCETADPVSGLKDSRALCRISVVDVTTNEVLLDTLVKPAWPVSDYRTWVNGIAAENLENVQFTLRHAQAFMLKLCSEETVIMGHALQNDLAAIRMIHHAVVDSAYLFPVKDQPNASISLKDLTKSVLSIDMPKTHDSVNDTRMTMECLKYWLQKEGKVEPIVRAATPTYAAQLFVHRIPKNLCEESHLSRMFLHHTSIEPTTVETIEFAGEVGKTHIIFKSGKHASLAFDSLEGIGHPDASGKLQKKVFLKTGGYVRVRKMVHERTDATSPHKSPIKKSETA
jgi:RNA exonuclease 1